MTVLSTFLESSQNLLSSDIKKHYEIEYSQGEKRCQNWNYLKHSFKGQSGTKSPVNPLGVKK